MKTETISYVKKNAAIALLKLLSFSVEDEKNGRVQPSASLKEKLAARKKAAQERDSE